MSGAGGAVYVVTGESGEYSDTLWWVDSVHATEDGAVRAIESKVVERCGRFGDWRLYDWPYSEDTDFVVFTHPRRHGNSWYLDPEQGAGFDDESWTIERKALVP